MFIREHNTPDKVQAFINKRIEYVGGVTLKSFRQVLETESAHCFEGALFAATVLKEHGFPPLILSLEDDDIDHMVMPYVRKNRWGAVGQSSKHTPYLKKRDPHYPTLQDLVASYAVNYGSKLNMKFRGYTVENLDTLDKNWSIRSRNMWFLDRHFFSIAHKKWPLDVKQHYYVAGSDKIQHWLKESDPRVKECMQRHEKAGERGDWQPGHLASLTEMVFQRLAGTTQHPIPDSVLFSKIRNDGSLIPGLSPEQSLPLKERKLLARLLSKTL
jgi:hypothetical protein